MALASALLRRTVLTISASALIVGCSAGPSTSSAAPNAAATTAVAATTGSVAASTPGTDGRNSGLYVHKGSQGLRIWVLNVHTQSSRLDLEKQLAGILLAEM